MQGTQPPHTPACNQQRETFTPAVAVVFSPMSAAPRIPLGEIDQAAFLRTQGRIQGASLFGRLNFDAEVVDNEDMPQLGSPRFVPRRVILHPVALAGVYLTPERFEPRVGEQVYSAASQPRSIQGSPPASDPTVRTLGF